MSIGSLGPVASFAGTSLAQTKAADVAKVQQETTDSARSSEGKERAENAAGIGQTEEDSGASDRDADGRRLWEEVAPAKERQQSEPDGAGEPHFPSKDPTGNSGGLLDVSG